MKLKKNIALIVTLFAVTWMVSSGSAPQRPDEQTVAKKTPPVQDVPEGWEPLFDGETLTGWKSVPYGGEGKPYIKDGALVLPMAVDGSMTGVCWAGDSIPSVNYVIYYEARRTAGDDIFASLTFPYKDTYASLIFGGWGGLVNGLSSIDGYDASENETTQHFSQRDNRWYPVELRATPDSIIAFVGFDRIVNLATAGKDIHLRSDILATGLTLWSYQSTGEIRDLRIRKLP